MTCSISGTVPHSLTSDIRCPLRAKAAPAETEFNTLAASLARTVDSSVISLSEKPQPGHDSATARRTYSRVVELGHELTVGGAGGGEALVAFLELQAQVDDLLFQVGDLDGAVISLDRACRLVGCEVRARSRSRRRSRRGRCRPALARRHGPAGANELIVRSMSAVPFRPIGSHKQQPHLEEEPRHDHSG